MNSRALMYVALSGMSIAVWVLSLSRRKKLKEDHALLWLAVSIVIIALSIQQELLLKINWFIGAGSPTSLILAAFIGFLLIITIFLSIKISELSNQNIIFVQEMALLNVIRIELNSDKKRPSQD